MARTQRSQPPEPGPPQVSPAQGVQRLETQIAKAEELLANRPLRQDEYSAWELVTRNCLEKAFGMNAPNVHSVMDVSLYAPIPMLPTQECLENRVADSLQKQKRMLEGLRDVLQMDMQLAVGGSPAVSQEPQGHKIFLVHGHDEGRLHEIARFLEKLQQEEVIILREQPNEGRTIIEKFETHAHADVGFVIVLLTGDDKGATATASNDELCPRARQNVIFELGYFIGKLGRKRVCALYVDGVEIPSDYSGVLYTKLDASAAWHFEIAKELRAAGLPVDMNLAL